MKTQPTNFADVENKVWVWNVKGRKESMMIPRILGRTVGGAGVGWRNQKFHFGPVKFENLIRHLCRDAKMSLG